MQSRAGLAYQHSKGCLRFRQNVVTDPAFAARAGLTQDQFQLAQNRGLLPDPTVETPSAASGAAGKAAAPLAAATAHTSTASSFLIQEQVERQSGSVPGMASGSVPGVT
eukprot:6294117-Amphidinium_carterae.1